VVFFAVFILSFMSADYLITGSVTNTWIGIAIMAGVLSATARKVVQLTTGARSFSRASH
jgi:hypothetical protein